MVLNISFLTSYAADDVKKHILDMIRDGLVWRQVRKPLQPDDIKNNSLVPLQLVS